MQQLPIPPKGWSGFGKPLGAVCTQGAKPAGSLPEATITTNRWKGSAGALQPPVPAPGVIGALLDQVPQELVMPTLPCPPPPKCSPEQEQAIKQVVELVAATAVNEEALRSKKAEKRAKQRCKKEMEKAAVAAIPEKRADIGKAKDGEGCGSEAGKWTSLSGCGTVEVKQSAPVPQPAVTGASYSGEPADAKQVPAPVLEPAVTGSSSSGAPSAVVAAKHGGGSSSSSWLGTAPCSSGSGNDGGNDKKKAKHAGEEEDEMEVELAKGSGDEDGDELLFRGDGDTYKHSCRSCDTFKKAHQLLLTSIEDWCGGLDLYCYDCATMQDAESGKAIFTGSERAFEKASKKMWRNRAKDKFGKEQRHHHMTWQKAKEMIAEKLKGMRHKDLRVFVLNFLTLGAMIMAADVTKTESSRACAVAVQQEFVLELQKSAASPLYVTVSQGWTLTSDQASYLFRVTEHILVSFICGSCFYYGGDWLESAVSYHFRCPICGTFYMPWSGKSYNKIIVIYD